MRKLLLFPILFLLASCPALAQCNGAFANNTVCGNVSGATDLPSQVPNSTFVAALLPTPVRAGDVMYWNGSAWTTLAGNNSGTQFFSENASGVPSWLPVVTTIDGLSGAFTTSNGITSAGNSLQLTAARRTTPTTQHFTSGTNATYTTPANVLWIEVKMVGPGGGGAGSSGTGGTGGTGTPANGTCWNTAGTACTTPLYNAGPGTGGQGNGSTNVGQGGTVGGSATCNQSFLGTNGGGGNNDSTTVTNGGYGGGSAFYGGGGSSQASAAGQAGTANTGGGGSSGSSSTQINGAGGGGGASCYFIISAPAATYTYTIGTGGTAGTAGAGNVGGAGAAGDILVIEHYGT